MRISLHAKSSMPLPFNTGKSVPLSVTIKPANNVLGTFEYQTDTNAFLKLLRQRTDLSDFALDTFRENLRFTSASRIPAVTFKQELLEEIGYFID